MKTPPASEGLIIDAAGAVRIELIELPELGLWMSRRPVSRAAYAGFDPGYPAGEGPAVGVSWDDAVRFCRWLGERLNPPGGPERLYRLPMEVEWESALRGRVMAEPVWKDICPEFGRDDDFARFGPAEAAEASPWGFERAGLAWEWTGDLYDPTQNCRILRGACWFGRIGAEERVIYHRTPKPSVGRPEVGFRIVRELAV